MEQENLSLKEKSLEFIKKNAVFLSLTVIGLLFLSYGIYEYFHAQKSTMEFVSASENVKGSDDKNTSQVKISVDIQGAVEKSGVYELKESSRIKDAIEIAGGLSSSADTVYVSKKINQAQKLVDGQKIYIPSVGEDTTSLISVQSGSIYNSSSGLIGINSSPQTKLEELPKIGPATASKIINARPYGDLSELVSKKVIGQKTFETIKDLIDLN